MLGIVSGVVISLMISIFGMDAKTVKEPVPKSYNHYNCPDTDYNDASRPMEALGGGFKKHKH